MRVKPIKVPDNYELLNCNVQDVVKLAQNSSIYRLTYERTTQMSLKDYRSIAMEEVERHSQNIMDEFGRSLDYLTEIEIQDYFWNELEKRSDTSLQTSNRPIPIYVIDNELSRFPQNWKWWNLNCLDRQVSGLSSESVKLPGINTPFLYYGMPLTAFAFHHEDST